MGIKKIATIVVGITCCWLGASGYTAPQEQVQSVKIDGYVGGRINACIEHRVKGQDVDELVAQFRQRTAAINDWSSEFWGKWMQGAVGCYRYSHDPAVLSLVKQGVDGLLATQAKDGYIGNTDPAIPVGNWEIWGRKYTALGLLSYYQLTHDKRALEATKRLIDYTIAQFSKPGAPSIVETGLYRGMPSSSILEPVVMLYNITGKKKYLDFAQYIVEQWETPSGPQLISKANVPVASRFPRPSGDLWYSRAQGSKAYEMMSCYEGLLELAKVTGNRSYIDLVENVAQHIYDEEINIAGSGASDECWYGGKLKQARPSINTMETCVTFTWMHLCNRLLRLTGNPKYADWLEQTTYNALFGSMKADGTQIVKYTPLEGLRVPGENQCNVHINCCNANGPRGYALIPLWAYTVRADSLLVNLYAPGTASFKLGKKSPQLTLRQETTYPVDGTIRIAVDAASPVRCAIMLRIPAWSQQSSVSVNGEALQGVRAGSYAKVERAWKQGDVITVKLDMRGRVETLGDKQAIVRGPVVLARDSRLADGFVDETCVFTQVDSTGHIALAPVTPTVKSALMEFSTKALMGTDSKGDDASVRDIHFINFSSAGDGWSPSVRYRTWLQRTLNLLLGDD